MMIEDKTAIDTGGGIASKPSSNLTAFPFNERQ